MSGYRIGLMAVHTNIDYPYFLRLGVQNTLEEEGHTLVAIAELIPYHTLTNAEAYMRVATEIASRLDLDAIIYPAGCVTAYLSGNTDKAIELLQQTMDPAKTLVLERDVEGFRCITKDNNPGMHECMRYLIETCGYTKIGFISGPEHSRGAQERESVYFEEMAAHGIEVAPSLFVRGDFGGACADVVEQLLDDNPDIEAIACACDLIAYTTYEVLNARKISVGTDIAVTGFDDHPRSAHLDPPLSTVHMTSYDFGCLAAREAIRLCEGKPQASNTISSTFIARSSCGENVRSTIDLYRELLRQKPFPIERMVAIIMDSTISMAGPHITADFKHHVETFMAKVRTAYLSHLTQPQSDDLLFSSHDLAELFARDYRAYLSLEGFHTVAITLLEALLEESPQEEANWVVMQISHLHLRIARMLTESEATNRLNINKREWITFHTVDDALRLDSNPTKAYRLMLDELDKLGVREADLFLLPEPVSFIGARAFALSDHLSPIGRLSQGQVCIAENPESIVFQGLLDKTLARYDENSVCTVGAIMAGNELLGMAVLDCGSISIHRQLMALLNIGAAVKHLQLIAYEREMNELLGRNNLMLTEQSQLDEMTRLLNRRGYLSLVKRALQTLVGSKAAVLYLDLDGLKTINDTFGHDAGDEAIKMTARTLESCMPEGGLLARLGGDEFVAFSQVESPDDADLIIARVLDAMARFNDEHDLPYELSISAGACVFDVDEDASEHLSEYMVQADAHLYEMKRHHKAARRK